MGRGGLGKPGILGAALFIAAALFLPLVRFRPNRILTGESFTLAELAPGGWAALALLTALALLFLLLHARGSLWRAPVSALAAVAAMLVLSWASRLPRFAGETSRVSIGAGFFVMLPASLLMLQGAGRKAARLGTLALLAAAACLLLLGAFSRLSLLREFEARREAFFAHTARHLALALSSAGAAAVLGILLSFLLLRFRRLEVPVVFAMNLAQTIPTLSLLGLLLALLVYLGREGGLLGGLGISGVGFLPAWIALLLYAVYPVLNNALAGLRMADAAALDAARAMGMSAGQVFLRVQLPLAAPLILGGVRTAVTQSMGNAVLAALIGGGGLGSLIFLGLAQSAADLVLLGVVPLIALTFAADAGLEFLERISFKRTGHDPHRIADQNL